MPDVAVPPVVITPRRAAVPMLTGLALFEDSRPPRATFSTSVPRVKVIALVAFVPYFSEPTLVLAAMVRLPLVALITVGTLAPLVRAAP